MAEVLSGERLRRFLVGRRITVDIQVVQDGLAEAAEGGGEGEPQIVLLDALHVGDHQGQDALVNVEGDHLYSLFNAFNLYS